MRFFQVGLVHIIPLISTTASTVHVSTSTESTQENKGSILDHRVSYYPNTLYSCYFPVTLDCGAWRTLRF